MVISTYEFIKRMTPSEGQKWALESMEGPGYDRWILRRRPDQVPPMDGYWRTWIYSGGRGAGKTRTGAEETNEYARTHPNARMIIVGRTAADIREVLVEGESGILAVNPRVKYHPGIRRLTWPNGAQAFCTSADEPDSLRGLEADFAWADEVALWWKPKKGKKRNTVDAWTNLRAALRTTESKVIVTTTPRKTKMLKKLHKELIEHPLGVRLTEVPTDFNEAGLAVVYLDKITEIYGNTGMAQTELQGRWPWKL